MSSRQSVTLPPDLLQDLSLEKLESLANKEEEFAAFFSQLQLSEILEIHRERDKINNTNRQLSLENTERKPLYEDKKAKLTDTCLIAAELKETYNQKYGVLKTLSSSQDQASVLRDLQEAMKTAETVTEDLAEDYIAGSANITSDEFISKYLAERSNYWSRKVKIEKLEEIMKQPLPYPGEQSQHAVPVPAGTTRPPYPPPPSHSLPVSNPPYPPSSVPPQHPPYASMTASMHHTNPSLAQSRPLPPVPSQSMPYPSNSLYTTTPAIASMPPPRYPPNPGVSYQQQGYPQPSYPQQSYRGPPPVGQPTQSYRYPYQQAPPSHYPAQYRGYPPR